MVISFPTERFTVKISQQSAKLLALLALHERRDPRDQASVILERALETEAKKVGISTNVVEQECSAQVDG